MKTVNDIKKILEEQKPDLATRFSVKELGIFGSYVRGEEQDQSDLDILVEFKDSVGLLAFMKLESYLAELIGIKVDLVMKSALKPRIGKHILQEVILI